MSDWRIPLSDLAYGEDEIAAALRVLRSGWLSSGPEVAAFEQEFATACGTRHAIAVSSATAGLHLALQAVGVGPGDEVVQPAVNFVAAANMTRALGAVPVFADIASPDEPTVTAGTVEPQLTERTKAVVVMHYGGTPADMAPLVALCEKAGVALVEDACHAVGATYGSTWPNGPGRTVGSVGTVACFSFFANKNLATGEGGMITTDLDDVAARCRLARSHGMSTLTWDRHRGHAYSYDVTTHGYNYRLDELHAALGRVQLARLPDNNRARLALLERYQAGIRRQPGWSMPYDTSDRPSSGHLAVALGSTTEDRDAARERLAGARVQTSFHYPLITSFTAFRDAPAELPQSTDFADRAITLPLHPAMSATDVDFVLSALAP